MINSIKANQEYEIIFKKFEDTDINFFFKDVAEKYILDVFFVDYRISINDKKDIEKILNLKDKKDNRHILQYILSLNPVVISKTVQSKKRKRISQQN